MQPRSLVASLAITLSVGLAPAQQPPAAAGAVAPVPARDDSAAEKLGWRLGVQAWTFRDRTTFEAIDTAQRLGLKYIELYPGQRLGAAHGDAKVEVDMPDALRQELLQKLAKSGVKLVNFGVVGLGKDEAAARKLFAFAKAMGIETLTCEPDPDAWDLAEKLAEEYHVNVACHDHPKPSRYWNPQTVLDAVKQRSQRLGACADTGHWPRSGLNPVACLDMLEGRILTLHFKDIAPLDKTGVDRPWGTGAADAKGMLRLLQQQGFRGVFSIEYETGEGKELEANVEKCIAFFDREAAQLLAQQAKSGAKAGGSDK